MRRGLKIAGAVAAAVTVVTVGLSAPGTKRTYDGPRAAAPAWADPCFERSPRPERTLLHRCARVRGRVLHVQRRSNDELHLAIVARWQLLIVKLELGADPPSVGSMATFVGPLVRTHYRFVRLEEVEAFAYE
jgi:hypothetical protein